ncbi:hypothetical protein AND_007098 [Anopheles darlingi]|uniref:Glutamate-gated chloride channel n=1 Tax=Anopheles darlingi TaxID=43151 RepID=W5JD14_ANODA|nr:hypothetical protein AND_007098 [Anopheles darlingi]
MKLEPNTSVRIDGATEAFLIDCLPLGHRVISTVTHRSITFMLRFEECPNMGYSYETVPNQHRPLRSDRTQPPSNEPYSYYGHEQRFHSNYEHFVSQQPHSTETSHSDGGFVRAWRSLKQPPTVHVDQENEGSRTQGAERCDQDDHEPEKQLLSFQRRTVAVLEQYSAIVLDTLSQLISRHVASDKRLRDGLRTGSTSGNDSMTDDEEPTLTPSSSGSTSNEPHRRPPSSRTCAPDALLAPLHEMGSCGRSKVSCPSPSVSQRTPPSSSSSSLASSSSPSTPVTKSTSSHHLNQYRNEQVCRGLQACFCPKATHYERKLSPKTCQDTEPMSTDSHLPNVFHFHADFCCGMHTPEMAKHIPDMRVPGRPQNRGPQKYEVEFLLQQQWFDPRLRYANQSQYEYLNAIHHHEDIWLPDTYFIMHGDFKDPIIPMHFALRIYRNGTINYLMSVALQKLFPHSPNLLLFALSHRTVSYEQSAITYVWKNDEDTLRKSPSLTTLNAYLIQNQTIACPIKASWRDRAFYFTTVFIPGIILVTSSFITFWLEWNAVPARSMIDRAFYFTTVFIPGIILVTSSFITFWLEWNAVPARVMIGVTTMLNFFTTSNGFRSTLPVVSNLTAMNVWDGVCMCFIYASLLEFVCVNYVGPSYLVSSRYRVTSKGNKLLPINCDQRRNGASFLSFVIFLARLDYQVRLLTDLHTKRTSRTKATHATLDGILSSNHYLSNEQETIEREFHTAIAAEKTTAAATAATTTSATAATAATATATNANASAGTGAVQSVVGRSATRATAASVERCEEGLISGPSGAPPHGPGHEPSDPGLTHRRPTVETKLNEIGLMETSFLLPVPFGVSGASCVRHHTPEPLSSLDVAGGVKKRESGGPNEIVACTSCAGGTSPCTHSANNGCATETCFVQVRKKEPPHPIRVAKTIDVIARITFPSAYAVFLIFFFIHYKGFS